MNPCLILTRNNLALTKRCVESVRKQEISTELLIVDNGSTDGTEAWDEWLEYGDVRCSQMGSNLGVSKGWNNGLDFWFNIKPSRNHVLVVGNDTVLAPWTYSALLSCNLPFVTGFDVGMSPLPEHPDIFPITPHPDFSCFLIKREVWEKVGPFNEALVNYCGDCDYHVRAHRLGVELMKASIPYNHSRSSTMRLAPKEEQDQLAMQANADREVFRSIYGVIPGQPGYEALFK